MNEKGIKLRQASRDNPKATPHTSHKVQPHARFTTHELPHTTTHTPLPAFISYPTTKMKKRSLVHSTLATSKGTPLAMSNEFKDREETAKQIEENKTPETTKMLLKMGGNYGRDRTLQRTHETLTETIVETRTTEDRLGNKHNLYLERKPTTALMEMRYNS